MIQQITNHPHHTAGLQLNNIEERGAMTFFVLPSPFSQAKGVRICGVRR